VAYSLLKSLKKVLGEAGLEKLTSSPVVPCPEAFGVVLKAERETTVLKK
jgi:ribonuclease Z